MEGNLGFHCHGLDHFQSVILDNDLHRGEFYNFPVQELDSLRLQIIRYGLAVSIHAPLLKPSWYPNPPTWSFLCDTDEAQRQMSMRMVAETMKVAGAYKAGHVVVHYPVPSTSDVSGYSASQQEDIAWRSAGELAELSRQSGIPIHIEGFGPSPFLNVEFLSQVMGKYPALHYCFDSGHMSLASQRDGFDMYDFAERLAPWIGSVHLWNGRNLQDYLMFRHIPVHPSQSPRAGWVDIPTLLRLILTAQRKCPVIFESSFRYPPALGPYEISEGVRWVKDIVAGLA